MFKKSKSPQKEDKVSPKPAESDFSPAPIPKPVIPKTVIGERIAIKGIIRGHENLMIEGSINGKIELEKNQIIVGLKGRVQAEINAKNVIICGQFKGNIHASDRVKITRHANFDGEIKTRDISVEDGTYLKAAIELIRDPKKPKPAAVKEISKPIQGTVGSSVNQPTEKSPL